MSHGASVAALRAERDRVHSSFKPAADTVPAGLRDSILSASVVELQDLISSGRCTAVQILSVYAARAHSVGWALGGVTDEVYDEALRAAAESDGRRARGEPARLLEGIPVSVKEHIHQKGTRLTCGLTCRAGNPPSTEDALVVAGLRAVGAVPFVRSNVPQLLMLPESTNRVYGTALNPWDASRTSGGSSGGEGTLIASRASVCGVGTDIGGSVRIPASFCGIAAFKPTPGRVSGRGIVAPRLGDLDGQNTVLPTAGPMGRCTDDLALMMRAWLRDGLFSRDPSIPRQPFDCGVYYAGAAPGVATSPTAAAALLHARRSSAAAAAGASTGAGAGAAPAAPAAGVDAGVAAFTPEARDAAETLLAAGPLRAVTGASVRRLRIGVMLDDGFFTPCAASARAVRETAAALTAAGHDVVTWSLRGDGGVDTRAAALSYYAVMGADGAMRFFREALEGEPLIPLYQKLYTLSRLPGWVRSIVAWGLRLAGKPRMADLLSAVAPKSAYELMALNAECARTKGQVAAAMRGAGIDLILCPAVGLPALPHGMSADLTPACSWCFLWNYLGMPSGVVPAARVREDEQIYTSPATEQDDFSAAAAVAMRGSAGLPVGVQLVGLPNSDELVMRGMAEAEAALRAAAAAASSGSAAPAASATAAAPTAGSSPAGGDGAPLLAAGAVVAPSVGVTSLVTSAFTPDEILTRTLAAAAARPPQFR